MVLEIIGTIIFGAVIGMLARLVLPGRNIRHWSPSSSVSSAHSSATSSGARPRTTPASTGCAGSPASSPPPSSSPSTALCGTAARTSDLVMPKGSRPPGRGPSRPRWSGGEAEPAHPPGVLVGEAGEHPAELGEVGARPVGTADPADQQRGERVALDRHLLRLRERLADQRRPHRSEPAGDPLVGRDGLPDDLDDEPALPTSCIASCTRACVDGST